MERSDESAHHHGRHNSEDRRGQRARVAGPVRGLRSWTTAAAFLVCQKAAARPQGNGKAGGGARAYDSDRPPAYGVSLAIPARASLMISLTACGWHSKERENSSTCTAMCLSVCRLSSFSTT